MALAAFLFLVEFGTVALGLVVGMISLGTGRRRSRTVLLSLAGIALSLTPLLTSMLVWNWIVARRGLIMEP